MTLISQVMDIDKLEQLINDRFISRKFHPAYSELAILNYTQNAQFDNTLVWKEELNNCRGLVYRVDTGEIIARPYKKFWNINDERHPETLIANLPTEIPVFADKLDGSMGTCFNYDGKVHVATRGSFISDQANWATNWLRYKANFPGKLPPGNTVITEIIYHENQIVVSYDKEELIVTGIIDNSTGKEANRYDLVSWCKTNGLPYVHEFNKNLFDCLHEDISNKEGYVLTFPSTGLKVKVKFGEYCRLHKVLTGLNPVSIWEILSSRNMTSSAMPLDKLYEWMTDQKMPTDFRIWVRKWHDQLTNDFNKLYSIALDIYSKMPICADRKTLALYFTNNENKLYASVLFSILDKKDSHSAIWRMIKPKAADTYRVEGE